MHEMYRTLWKERWLCIKKHKTSRPLVSLSCNTQAHILPEALLLGMGVLSHSVVSNSVWLHGLSSQPDSSVMGILQAGKLEWITISFSRGWIFLTQGLIPHLLCLLHCRRILHPLSHQGRHYCLECFGMIFQKAQGHSYIVLPCSYLHLLRW